MKLLKSLKSWAQGSGALVSALAASLMASPGVFASEGAIGNGGGAWVCQNADALGTLRWAQLVDLYEARTEFGLIQQEMGERNYHEIIDLIRMKLFSVDKGFYEGIQKQLETVEPNLVFVDADLEIVDDALYRIRPSKKECLGGTISYVQLANYTNYGKILIQKGVFEDPRLGEVDKAALMIHEAVYAYLRERFQEKDSVCARRIVGLLFSTMRAEEVKKEIEKLLGSFRMPWEWIL